MRFHVAAIGCGLARYRPEQPAPMFGGSRVTCQLPEECYRVLVRGKVERSPAMDGKRMMVLLMPIKAVAKPRVNPAAKPAVEAKPTA